MLAALVALAVSDLGSDGGSGSRPNFSYEWQLNGPVWVEPAFLLVALGLVVAAGMVWAAGRPIGLLLGLALLVLMLGVGAWVFAVRFSDNLITRAEAARVALGTPRDEVRARLGFRAGHATLSRDGTELECDVYLNDRVDGFGDSHLFFFCFEADRLVSRERS